MAKGPGFTAVRGVADARADFGRLDPNAKPSQTEGLFLNQAYTSLRLKKPASARSVLWELRVLVQDQACGWLSKLGSLFGVP